MGAPKRFKDDYPIDQNTEINNTQDKLIIKAYLEKLAKLLESPDKQKKAAEILSRMINNKK